MESEYEHWKTRKLAERYRCAFADGTYFTVIYNGEGCKMPILAVVGIAETGERDVLAFSVGDRENEQAWKDLTAAAFRTEGSCVLLFYAVIRSLRFHTLTMPAS